MKRNAKNTEAWKPILRFKTAEIISYYNND